MNDKTRIKILRRELHFVRGVLFALKKDEHINVNDVLNDIETTFKKLRKRS